MMDYSIRAVPTGGLPSRIVGVTVGSGTDSSNASGSVAQRSHSDLKGQAMKHYTDEQIDQMSDEEVKEVLKKCMAEEEDEEDEEAEEEEEDEEEDDKPPRSKSAGRVRVAALEEAKRFTALGKIDIEFRARMGGDILSDDGKENGLAEAIRKGRSPKRYRRDCEALARSMGINI